MSWYLVHTKPRQEQRALVNLMDQHFECWMPRLRRQQLVQQRLVSVEEPLFPRYLFIKVDDSVSWSPVKSTPGVTTIVRFGGVPGRVPDEIVAALQAEESLRLQQPVKPKFAKGQAVNITAGPFAGVSAVFDMQDGEARALVLIELLSRPARLPVPVVHLQARTEDSVPSALVASESP